MYGCTIVVLAILKFADCSFLTFVAKENEDPKLQVSITTGTIQGAEDLTVDKNVTYYRFQGIPYAAPPVGSLRWQPPRPHEKWNGVLNATVERPICVQMSDDEGNEDCLFINVYSSKKSFKMKNDSLTPVMIWIYGGRFANGFSNQSMYGPDYLLEKGVVFVSFNYRVGIFGFLSTGDLSIPGNYGLKDQVFALEWVRNNIRKFGGDPDQVTLFGESAGASSVGYLLLIKKADGLFHGGILQSGSPFCQWSFQRSPLVIALSVAVACGIFETQIKTLTERLLSLNTKSLRKGMIAASFGGSMEPIQTGLPFAPCLEPLHEQAVLTEHSIDLFSKGKFHKVPIVIGFNSQEASITQDIIELARFYIVHYDLKPQLLIPSSLNVTSKADRKDVGNSIKQYYFGKGFISNSPKSQMMDFIGDTLFVRPILHMVKLCAKYTNIYLYMFSYEGLPGRIGTAMFNRKGFDRKVKGAGHAEDVFYLFKQQNARVLTPSDMNITAVMTMLWTNFAINGEPASNDTIYWPAINKNNLGCPYLNIDTALAMKSSPRADAMEFWDDLYKKYGKKHTDTY